MKRLLPLLLMILLVACLPETTMHEGAVDGDADRNQPADQASPARMHAGRADTVFPKSPMPQHLTVLDGHVLSVPMKLLMVSLQGVLAKTEPRLYFHPSILNSYDPAHEEEVRWLNEMETKWDVTSETASDPWAVFDSFVDEIEGYIVYDPDVPQTVNLATTLAGLENAVIAHPDLIADLNARGLTAVMDLRGQFVDNVALYTWAFDEVWPEANQTIVAFLDDNSYPLRDYLVANNIFVFQLDPHHYAERPLLETILSTMPANIPILGWPLDELLGVIIFSQHGKFHIATDHVSNLSAHSGLPRPELSQTHITEWPEVENKIHIAFAYTDGDSIAYMNRWMADWWDDPAFDTLPLGWEISANQVDLGPDVIGYFYDRLTENNVIIGPACGIGYIYPSHYPDLDAFLALTDEYMQMADMRTIWLINDDLTLPDDIANQYGEVLDLLGIFIDYWPNSDKGWYMTSNGTPVLRSHYVYLVGPEQIPGILDDAAIEKEFLYPDMPTFVFIGVNGWGTSPTYLKSLVDELDDRYLVLRPDAMFAAMRTAAEKGWLP